MTGGSLGRAPAWARVRTSPGRPLRHACQPVCTPLSGVEAAGWEGQGRGRVTAERDLHSQADTSPSSFVDGGEEGDKGKQNLRQIKVLAK